MSLNETYEDDNIFAKILKGELPCAKVYEDEETLAFMDIFPQSRGHTLVIPKTPSVNLFDLAPEVLATLAQRTQIIARAVRAALDPDGVVITQFNGADAGQTVFHIHVHVIPRYAGEALGRHGGGQADPAELSALAEQIAAHIEG